jgi:hypothetical protein
MTKISIFSLDCYNKNVIKMIMEKYGLTEMEAAREFLMSETHRMLEDTDMAMWEFSARAIFDMWEVEKITGNPRNSVHLRSE